MTIQTRYINKDDFKAYFGIDLDYELHDSENPSNNAEAFLYRVEIEMETMLNCLYFKNITEEYPKLSDYQKEHYQLALLYQAYYKFKNGDIINDSGYDFETGDKANTETILSKSLAPLAKMQLELTGLLTRHINARRKGISIW